MGLAERRAIKGYQDNQYPHKLQQIHTAAAFALPVEVEWDTLGAEGYAELLPDAFTKVYFQPLIAALEKITIDDMGKEALKAGISKVIIRWSGTTNIAVTGNVLLIDQDPVRNIDYWEDRRDQMVTELERAL